MTSTPQDLTLDQIMAHFATDEAAREYLETVRWPNGPVCPHCDNADLSKLYDITPNPAKKIRAGLRECKDCGGSFTVTVGTIFEDSKVPLRKWLVAWYMLCTSKKGVSARQIQRMLELGSYRTAWFMMHRIRYALRDPVFADKLGGGGQTVEADETYVGGKPRLGGKPSKRGRVNGTFHHISAGYMDQYLAEFDFRYSNRELTDGARTNAALKKIEGKRLMLHQPRTTVG